MSKVLLINGPNLNLLGVREPEIYGHTSLSQVEDEFARLAEAAGIKCKAFQSNSEGELIDMVQRAIKDKVDAIVINPGAYAHTSIALMDALVAFEGLAIEVHVSNIYAREEFREHSFISAVVDTVICGAGIYGYTLASNMVCEKLNSKKTKHK